MTACCLYVKIKQIFFTNIFFHKSFLNTNIFTGLYISQLNEVLQFFNNQLEKLEAAKAA